MSIYNREDQYISLLSLKSHSVKDLAQKLFISEPTVRRDIASLKNKDLVFSKNGVVSLKTSSPDRRIPLFIRDLEQSEEKKAIALKASGHIKDGYTVMLDASTSAYHMLPFLSQFKDILVITNGAKTALEAASMGIRTISTGGEMTLESFSFIGPDAESTLRRYNADVAFFSCRGVSSDGLATDCSIQENSIRRIMIKNSKESFLLCDKKKHGKVFINTLCTKDEITDIITE